MPNRRISCGVWWLTFNPHYEHGKIDYVETENKARHLERWQPYKNTPLRPIRYQFALLSTTRINTTNPFTMKMFVIFAVVIAAALASDLDTTVLKSESQVNIDGYNFAYETSDGVAREESALLKNVGTEQEALVVRGSIQWTAPNGEQFNLRYVADENGYQPEAAHLPVAPVA